MLLFEMKILEGAKKKNAFDLTFGYSCYIIYLQAENISSMLVLHIISQNQLSELVTKFQDVNNIQKLGIT